MLENFLGEIRKIDTREKCAQLLTEMPEQSPEELDQMIAETRKTAYQFRPLLLKLGKNLPHSPGGASLAVRPEKHKEIINKILTLKAKRVKLRDAFKRVAQQQSVGSTRAVSSRTIERIWQRRKGEEDAV